MKLDITKTVLFVLTSLRGLMTPTTFNLLLPVSLLPPLLPLKKREREEWAGKDNWQMRKIFIKFFGFWGSVWSGIVRFWKKRKKRRQGEQQEGGSNRREGIPRLQLLPPRLLPLPPTLPQPSNILKKCASICQLTNGYPPLNTYVICLGILLLLLLLLLFPLSLRVRIILFWHLLGVGKVFLFQVFCWGGRRLFGWGRWSKPRLILFIELFIYYIR